MTEIDCIVDVGTLLGECPLWVGDEQVLYWIDIEAKLIHRFDPATGRNETRPLPARPGSLAATRQPGRLLLASENELVWYDWDHGVVTPWIELEPASTGNRLNDGRCDPAGRFVVGSMWPEVMAGHNTGSLYVVEANGTARTVRTGVGVPNGIAFDPERQLSYFADTPTQTVWVWDYDSASGERLNQRVFLDYSDLPGLPDGACVDADGCYWSASVYGWAVIRVTPGGSVDRRIELPVEKPSMPAFGGPRLDVLYVTSISDAGGLPSAPGREGFPPGALLAIDAGGVQGIPEPAFAATGPAVG